MCFKLEIVVKLKVFQIELNLCFSFFFLLWFVCNFHLIIARSIEKRHSNSSVRRDPPARPPPAAAPTVVNKVNNNNFSNDVIDNSVQIRNPPKPLNSKNLKLLSSNSIANNYNF